MRSENITLTDGQLLWRGLSAAPTELLASNLALLEATGFFGVLSKKAESLWKREGDKFAELLQARTAELKKLSREVLLLRLLGNLRAMSDLPAVHYVAQRDLIDSCQQIAAKALEFQQDADKDFSGESLADLISYQMQRILGELKKKFSDLDTDKQAEIVGQLKEYLDSLPEEQQQELRKQLGADEITAEVVRNAIITGSLSVAFATLVNALGFSFYMGAVSVLAAVAGLAGLTLPFAAYTTLTSAIAVMVDPITITAMLAMMLTFGWWRSENTLRETLLPIATVQLASAQAGNTTEQTDQLAWDVLNAWFEAMYAIGSMQAKLTQMATRRENLVSEREQAQAVLQAAKKAHKNSEKELKAGWMRVQELVPGRSAEMAAGDWGADLVTQGELLRKLQAEAGDSGDSAGSDSRIYQVRDSVTGVFKSFKRDWNIDSIAIDITDVLKKRCSLDGLSDPVLLGYLGNIESYRAQLADAAGAVQQAEIGLAEAHDRLATHDSELGVAREQLKAAENAYPGLKKASSLPNTFPLVRPEKPPVLEQKALQYISQPLVKESDDQRMRRLLTGGQGDIAFAGLTVGDFIYDYARVDPPVVEAADFARAADIGDPLSFAAFAVEQSTLEGAAQMGMENQLQGYVAERLVAQHMSAAGYDVSFPESASQPGWDVLIDGEPFQVKCGASAELVHSHFEKYPDIPVIVNLELGEKLGEHPGVYVDQELSVEHVRAMTKAGLEQGEELADFELPLIALTVSAAIEARSLLRGEGALDAAIVNVLTNAGGRMAGGAAGQVAGSVLGVLLFGPAGGIIGALGGTVGGANAAAKLVRRARRLMAGAEADAVRASAQKTAAKATSLMAKKRAVWAGKQEKIGSQVLPSGSDGEVIQKYLTWRMSDQGLYLEKCGKELELLANQKPDGDPLGFAKRVLSLVRRAAVHPHLLQGELEELFGAVKAYMEKLANYRAAG